MLQWQIFSYPVFPAKSFQRRGCQYGTVILTVSDLAQPGIHVPPDIAYLQVRTAEVKLSRSPQAVGAYS